MKIINIFGGPGTGKSTLACEVFVALKKMGKDVELVTEFAKDLTYLNDKTRLNDQLYVTAEQNNRISRLKDSNPEFVVTDSPIFMGLAYVNYKNESMNIKFKEMVTELFLSYDNINFVIYSDHKYSGFGRNETEKEAKQKHLKIRRLMKTNLIDFKDVKNVDDVLLELFNK